MRSGRFKLLLLFTILSAFVAASCHKNNVDDIEEEPPVCSFTGRFRIQASGTMVAGDTIQFNTDLPACAKKHWMFTSSGNNFSISTYEANPKLVFTEPGNYNVIIVVDDDNINQKGLNPATSIRINNRYNPATVLAMNGLRHWHVYEDSMLRTSYERDTVKHYQETAAIEVIDDSTIRFKNVILKSWSHERTEGVVDAYNFSAPSNREHEWQWLAYYYKSDSIVYSSHPYQGGYPAQSKSGMPFGITTTYYSIR
jgi:hypothetical protein